LRGKRLPPDPLGDSIRFLYLRRGWMDTEVLDLIEQWFDYGGEGMDEQDASNLIRLADMMKTTLH